MLRRSVRLLAPTGAEAAASMKQQPKCCWQILGLDPTKPWTELEVKKAFRNRAKMHHPDVKGGCVIKYRELQEAYEQALNRNGPKNEGWKPASDFYDHPHSYGYQRNPDGAERHTWTTRTRDPTGGNEKQRTNWRWGKPRSTGMSEEEFYRKSKPYETGFTQHERSQANHEANMSMGWYFSKRLFMAGALTCAFLKWDDKDLVACETAQKTGTYEGTVWGKDDSKASTWSSPRQRPMDKRHEDNAKAMSKIQIRDDLGVIPKQRTTSQPTAATFGGHPYTPEGLQARRDEQLRKRRAKAAAKNGEVYPPVPVIPFDVSLDDSENCSCD